MTNDDPVGLAVARVARDSCRRLIAYLASRSGNIAQAEDALADALCAALETWPQTGVPDQPEAWLLTTARRRLIDAYRHANVQSEAATTLLAIVDEAVQSTAQEVAFPDERLKLMFVCAHPAIDVAVRTPLMLQVVLGVDAQDIASAFLVKPATMGQRLSRAKAKIRGSGIPYEVPSEATLPARLDAVLQAIYGIYGIGWDDLQGADAVRRGYANEALELGRLLHHLMPRQAEVKGLLALMLQCEARRPSRLNTDGEFVPLSEQDTALWQQPLIEEANELLQQAGLLATLGRFQIEAAIQSVHNHRATSGQTDWPSIALLYDGLASFTQTLGVLTARASAWAKVKGPAYAIQLLDDLPRAVLENYQPYWALLARLLTELDKPEEAIAAFDRAIGLCIDPITRNHLLKQQMSVSRIKIEKEAPAITPTNLP